MTYNLLKLFRHAVKGGSTAAALQRPHRLCEPDVEERTYKRESEIDYSGEVEKTFEKFKDYWIALPGQKGSKLNWTATWRNWVRNQNGGAQTKGNSLAERNQAVAALWLAEQDAKEKGVEREIN